MKKEIIDCELAYSECFSDYHEDKDIIRFRNSLLQDMYDHNYTYIKRCRNDHGMLERIEHEISLRIAEQQTFCKILLDCPSRTSFASMFANHPSVDRLGVYTLCKNSHLGLKGNDDCNILRIDNPKTAEEKLHYDLLLDKDRLGEDFCRRRAVVRNEVYLKDGGVNAYVCYHGSSPVGTCELFLFNGVAKIEDFTVLPQEQRKGYGTSILKHLIKLACKNKARIIYLVTDEEDTAKDMYCKFGFKKIHEMTNMLFML